MRSVSQRVLLIIATTRRRLRHGLRSENTGLARQFCDEGHFYCVFHETVTGNQYLNNAEMAERIMELVNERNQYDLVYADDVELDATQMNP